MTLANIFDRGCMSSYTVAVVSANALFREGIRQMLARREVDVVGDGRSIAEAFSALSLERYPQLVVFHLASNQDVQASLDLLRQVESTKVVILADVATKPILPNLVWSNVSAILMTDISGALLQGSLELVLCGHRLFPADIMPGAVQKDNIRLLGCADAYEEAQGAGDRRDRKIAHLDDDDALQVDEPLYPSLSRRERQVVKCLAIGLSNKTIARELRITEGTVKVHVKGLLRKVRASNRTQLAVWAIRHTDMETAKVAALPPPDARNAA